MGRKRDGGALGDLYELAAIIPWWAGVALAIATYIALHLYAVAPVPPQPPGKASVSADQIFKPIAGVFQYLLPLVLLAGAAASGVKQARRKRNVSNVSTAESSRALLSMPWQEFETLVSDAFKRRGFSVRETGSGHADGGVDLVLVKGADKYLVQCKQWRATRVGVVPLRELYGLVASTGAAGGYMVTSGNFTDEAREFARGCNLELVDGEKLFAMFKDAGQAPPTISRSPVGYPLCPRCGFSMVRRTARQGPNAGHDFWGCAMFPKCKGIKPI